MTETTSRPSADRSSDYYAVEYDRFDDEPLTVSIADAVATYRDVEVTDLEPLHHAIDTDALERLFEPRPNGFRTGGTVQFEYSGCLVTVSAGGEIRIEPASE